MGKTCTTVMYLGQGEGVANVESAIHVWIRKCHKVLVLSTVQE